MYVIKLHVVGALCIPVNTFFSHLVFFSHLAVWFHQLNFWVWIHVDLLHLFLLENGTLHFRAIPPLFPIYFVGILLGCFHFFFVITNANYSKYSFTGKYFSKSFWHYSYLALLFLCSLYFNLGSPQTLTLFGLRCLCSLCLEYKTMMGTFPVRLFLVNFILISRVLLFVVVVLSILQVYKYYFTSDFIKDSSHMSFFWAVFLCSVPYFPLWIFL